ncbi:hypothetical protein [Aulosira sp. FACHB-615]|uniref:hypothetical protein n=1 Tax=Aulosira sp. FACHB-615 TaxID=2692777 RepID=UPI0016899419|nr:hypothetical protein [Aulosira sp. FACHB-615]MBD2491250.1 hypothetical protein [Aulosira sp. FACHB-615]
MTQQQEKSNYQFKSQKSSQFRYFILLGLLSFLFLHSFWKYGVLNQVIGFILPKAQAQVPVIKSPNGFLPDWSRLKFSNMIISEDGKVTFQANGRNETRIWKSGQSIATFLKLGDFEDTELSMEKLNLSTISRTQGIRLNQLRLSDFQLMNWQTLPSLSRAVPGLNNRLVKDVKPLDDFLKRQGIFASNRKIGNLLQIPRLQRIRLGQSINLKNYRITDIPGIDQAAFERFAYWQESFINGVPRLSDLSWNNFPGLLNVDLSFVGKVDLVLREIEANRVRTISGSYQQGFNVPCLQDNCAHAEMSGIGRSTGVQWISGKYQKVRGGFGVLRVLNNGQEPTGRNPFGSAFKQVVWDIDESTGSMQTTMFFRICKTIPFIGRTCSPYFIGPVPFIQYREKDPIILGQPHSIP